MSPTLLADPGTAAGDLDDFDLDLRVIESSVPIAELRCDTNDACGSTCNNASACVSHTNNPF